MKKFFYLIISVILLQTIAHGEFLGRKIKYLSHEDRLKYEPSTTNTTSYETFWIGNAATLDRIQIVATNGTQVFSTKMEVIYQNDNSTISHVFTLDNVTNYVDFSPSSNLYLTPRDFLIISNSITTNDFKYIFDFVK